MDLPNFLCIGAQRAGTTWLYEMLSKHPELFLPAQKELHFFDEKPDFDAYQGLGKPGRSIYYDLKSRDHWGWYQEQFKPGRKHKVKGEITPYYAVLSEQRVAFIAKKIPGLKIIYIIRNPIQRAWSGFRLFWSAHYPKQECQLDPDELFKTIMYPAKLIHGDYQRNTVVYEKFLGRSRILYLFYDDIAHQPQEVLTQTFRFLGASSMQFELAELKERVNTAPGIAMPKSIEKALSDYYMDQMAFIQSRFGRVLEY